MKQLEKTKFHKNQRKLNEMHAELEDKNDELEKLQLKIQNMECEEKETKNQLNLLGVKLQVKVKIINDMKQKNKEKEQEFKKKLDELEKDI